MWNIVYNISHKIGSALIGSLRKLIIAYSAETHKTDLSSESQLRPQPFFPTLLTEYILLGC